MEPAKNPSIRYSPVTKRVFHRDRNYAIILGLLDSDSRIGEMLSLKVDDYRPKKRQIVIRESKGREPRTLPVSPEWVEALNVWLRQRSKIMAGQEGFLQSASRFRPEVPLGVREISVHKQAQGGAYCLEVDEAFFQNLSAFTAEVSQKATAKPRQRVGKPQRVKTPNMGLERDENLEWKMTIYLRGNVDNPGENPLVRKPFVVRTKGWHRVTRPEGDATSMSSTSLSSGVGAEERFD